VAEVVVVMKQNCKEDGGSNGGYCLKYIRRKQCLTFFGGLFLMLTTFSFQYFFFGGLQINNNISTLFPLFVFLFLFLFFFIVLTADET